MRYLSREVVIYSVAHVLTYVNARDNYLHLTDGVYEVEISRLSLSLLVYTSPLERPRRGMSLAMDES